MILTNWEIFYFAVGWLSATVTWESFKSLEESQKEVQKIEANARKKARKNANNETADV